MHLPMRVPCLGCHLQVLEAEIQGVAAQMAQLEAQIRQEMEEFKVGDKCVLF
jgi:hypothetical protein